MAHFCFDRCKRCGTCCLKGGPALHADDKELVEQGHIPLKNLYTIRKGEPAFDNVRGYFFKVSGDIIRLKSPENSAACVFYDKAENTCEIYLNRPVECRALKCWDTGDIEEVYSTERISRKDLLGKNTDFSELVEYHESKCDYFKIKDLIDNLEEGRNRDALERLRETLAFDEHLRALAVEKSVCDMEILDFLLGRPLAITLPGLGLKVARKNGIYLLSPAPVNVSMLSRTC